MRDVRTQHGKAGFTLLELLMVVIIIAILASIALPQYLRVAERSRAAEALTVLGAIRSSELRYKALDPQGDYTTDLAELDIEIPGIGATPASTMWTYTVAGTTAGSNAVATRLVAVGGVATPTIQIDLDGGGTCAPGLGTTYGLSNVAC